MLLVHHSLLITVIGEIFVARLTENEPAAAHFLIVIGGVKVS